MSTKELKQPATAFASPRFCNVGNFMRMERVSDPDGLDFVVYGIPFDTACSYRSGARFGPQGIRNISVMMKTNHPVHEVNLFDYLKGADMGDVNVVPGYIHPTYSAIEAFASRIVDAGALPIALGGDHSNHPGGAEGGGREARPGQPHPLRFPCGHQRRGLRREVQSRDALPTRHRGGPDRSPQVRSGRYERLPVRCRGVQAGCGPGAEADPDPQGA